MTGARAARRRAIVVGGSLGGLLAANLLLRSGWDVRVYERVGEALAGRGAGIVTHPELRAILTRAGAAVDDTLGVAVDGRVTLDRSGATIGSHRAPQILTAWGRIYSLLKAAFPAERYLAGRELVRVEQDARGVSAVFVDGGREAAELLVAADGIRSAVRAQFLPQVRPAYAGYVAWRGLVEETALSREALVALAGKLAFCLPPREQMLGYLVAGRDDETVPGHRRLNFVWYRPADEARELPRLLTDARGERHELSIAPDAIEPALVAEMRRDAEKLLAPQFAEVVAKTEQPFLQPIYDLESPAIAFGRVALVGDAAFVARPHCGMGVTKAAGDATALADRLSDPGVDVAAALSAYGAERVAFGKRIVAHARRLGTYLEARRHTPEERALAAHYRIPEVVMRETAAPLERIGAD